MRSALSRRLARLETAALASDAPAVDDWSGWSDDDLDRAAKLLVKKNHGDPLTADEEKESAAFSARIPKSSKSNNMTEEELDARISELLADFPEFTRIRG